LISDVPVDPNADYAPPDLGPADSPDPYARPAPESRFFTLDQLLNGTPIELQRLTIEEKKIFPIWGLTGFRFNSVEDGHLTGTLPSSAWFSNGGPSVYGGVLAWAADFAMGAAVYSTLSAGDVFATLDMHIRFIRPAAINSGDFTLDGVVNHRGKRLRVSSCNIDDAQGRRVAMATASALVVEGGIRELQKGRLPEEILAEASRTGP
jgi:uncharacterized protein (TIGR00369 family)